MTSPVVNITVIGTLEAMLLGHSVVELAKEHAAEEIAAEARAIAPVGTSAENDRHPGEYRDSIRADHGVVVAETPIASFVEFGVPSRGIAAQYPFRRAASSLGYKFK